MRPYATDDLELDLRWWAARAARHRARLRGRRADPGGAAAAELLRDTRADLKVRFVNVVDLMA